MHRQSELLDGRQRSRGALVREGSIAVGRCLHPEVRAKECAMQVTIARLYETHPDAVRVVEALLIAGVPAQDISLISNNSDNWFDPGTADSKAIESKPTDIKPSAVQPSDV